MTTSCSTTQLKWQFQDEGKENYPKAVRVPANPENCRQSIYATNLERCLKEYSAAQALNSSAHRVTSTISGRGPVRIAKVWRSTSWAQSLLSSTFAHCVALNCVWLPLRLTQIGKEVFLNCVVLQEVVIPTELSDMGNRAFCGCEQLQRFTSLDWSDIEQWVQAEHNAFFMCDKFEKPQWAELLPAEGPDSDASDEELHHECSNYHASP